MLNSVARFEGRIFCREFPLKFGHSAATMQGGEESRPAKLHLAAHPANDPVLLP